MKRAVNIIVSGKVQAVFFRASTLTEAKGLGLKGYVMNLPDGNVLIEVEGEDKKIEQLVEWCRIGPVYARVTDVRVEEIEVRNRQNFYIRYA
jgi:acylphosphatase